MANSPVDVISNNPTGSIFNPAFLQGALERGIKTGFQFVLGVLGFSAMDGASGSINAFDLDWLLLLGTFLGGAFISFAFSVVNPEFVAGKVEIVRPPQSAGGTDTPAAAGLTGSQDVTVPVAGDAVVPAQPPKGGKAS